MILVTGGNGNFGRRAAELLLSKVGPGQFAVMTRDPQKTEDLKNKGIEVLKGDYSDYPSLLGNFRKVDQLLFISSGTIEKRQAQHRNVINAAKEAGVKHIYYTSFVKAKPDPYFKLTIDHYETEIYLKDSGLTYTIFRNAFYMDELPGMIGDALQTGKIYYPAGNGQVSFALRDDLVEASINVITGTGYENKTLDLDADTGYSFYDIADTLTEVIGKKVEYIDILLEAFQLELIKRQYSLAIIEIISQVALAIKHGEGDHPDPTLGNLLGRKPVSLKEFLRHYFTA
jgi:NAD(P)H dehydrogenase (quinone)